MLYTGIIGAGKGGMSILKTLLTVPELEVIGVCDSNPEAPGIKLAEDEGIPVYTEFNRLLDVEKEKIIIEVTGIEKLREKIISAADQKTTILDASAALLIHKIVESRENMIQELEREAAKLASLARDMEKSITDITATSEEKMENLNNAVEELISSSNRSKTHIDETSQIIKFINNVAEQTKILGLNAAIEAARADNRMSGFKVVATEIRKLADDTNESVARITTFIEELHKSIDSNLEKIEDMNNRIQNFTRSQHELTSELNSIAEKINRMSVNLTELGT